MNKIIHKYLDSKYPNEFDIHYVNSREIAMYYNGERFLFMNPRSSYISYHMRVLNEIKDWFGQIQFNELRPIINNWIYDRYNTTNANEFRDHIMNNKDIYKS